MKTIIYLDGGIGRIICSIPAILKFNKLNPDLDWNLIVSGWDSLFWGIPEIQNRVFSSEAKGVFENYWLKADRVISPEPYRVPKYYRNEISLIEAFDYEINGDNNHDDLDQTCLISSSYEIDTAYRIISDVKIKQKKKKTIIIQPYGSTAYKKDYGIVDFSNRSIPEDFYNCIVDFLMKDYNVIYMGHPELHDGKTYLPPSSITIRDWISIIECADYFVGCDSCGQHIAKATNQNASVFIAGTHEINISYPEVFHIIKKDLPFYHDAMRISGLESSLSSILNERRVEFSEEEIENYCNEIKEKIENQQN